MCNNAEKYYMTYSLEESNSMQRNVEESKHCDTEHKNIYM